MFLFIFLKGHKTVSVLVLLFSSLWWRPSATADRIWNINNLDGLRLHISQALNCARCSAAPAKCSTDAANGFWLSCCHDSTSTCMSDTVERIFSRPGGFSFFFLEKQGSCDVELRETKRHPQNYKSTLLACCCCCYLTAVWGAVFMALHLSFVHHRACILIQRAVQYKQTTWIHLFIRYLCQYRFFFFLKEILLRSESPLGRSHPMAQECSFKKTE